MNRLLGHNTAGNRTAVGKYGGTSQASANPADPPVSNTWNACDKSRVFQDQYYHYAPFGNTILDTGDCPQASSLELHHLRELSDKHWQVACCPDWFQHSVLYTKAA